MFLVQPRLLSALCVASSLFAVSACESDAGERSATRAATKAARPLQRPVDNERLEDLPQYTAGQAARIARRIALVTAGRSRVVEAQPGTPFTRTRFAVDHVVKGRLGRTMTLQVIGGQL